MSTSAARPPRLHAPADDEDYRGHLYEATHTMCHRTGWVAVGRQHVTCPRCLCKLEHNRARALRKPLREKVLRWVRPLGRAA